MEKSDIDLAVASTLINGSHRGKLPEVTLLEVGAVEVVYTSIDDTRVYFHFKVPGRNLFVVGQLLRVPEKPSVFSVGMTVSSPKGATVSTHHAEVDVTIAYTTAVDVVAKTFEKSRGAT